MECEVRKHITQMTTEEKTLLNNYLKKNYKLNTHTKNRQKEKYIDTNLIHRAIQNGSIVEYHYKGNNRILGNTNENGINVCCVLDIDNMEVVTVYDNEVKDKHYTLDKSKYRKNFDIKKMLN